MFCPYLKVPTTLIAGNLIKTRKSNTKKCHQPQGVWATPYPPLAHTARKSVRSITISWSLQVHEDAGKLCLVYLIRAGEIPATGGRLGILKGSLTWSGRRHLTLSLSGMLLSEGWETKIRNFLVPSLCKPSRIVCLRSRSG